MAKILARTVISTVLFLLLFFCNDGVSGRFSQFKRADQLVSDGQVTDNAAKEEVIESSVLRFKGMDHSSEAQCEHMYGFLPCSESLLGHLFLIVVYEYLLFHGETYLLSGGGRIFEILGTGFFGASGFPIIAQLPESLILLVTGLFSSDEGAQENVLTGVGMVAGSTILNLTLLWAGCLFFGRQVFVQKADANPGNKSSAETEQKKPPSPTLWTGYGVGSDEETSFTAKVMLASLIPLIILVLPNILDVPYGSRVYDIDIVVTLFALVVTLVAYFIYQFSHSSLQDRRLEYLKAVHQTHVLAVIQHVQEFLPELVDEHGRPDEAEILRLFKQLDKDDDGQLSVTEIKELFNRIRLISKSAVLSREKIIQNFIKEFDHDGDKQISFQEFMNTFKHWLHTVCAVDEPQRQSLVPVQTIKHLYEAINPALEQEKLNNVRKELLEEVQNPQDGESDEYNWTKLIGANTNQQKVNRSAVAWFKAISLLVVGIAMLAVLAEPLIHSVQKFASSANIPSFYVAFVLVPVATSARTAISAILAVTVKEKISKNTLLTFSEIYDAVFMNNVLGFSVLLSVVYFRGLIWHFSAEVMIVVMVCSTMGLIASFKSRFPVWMMFVAILLYPLSLVFVYFVDDYFWSP